MNNRWELCRPIVYISLEWAWQRPGKWPWKWSPWPCVVFDKVRGRNLTTMRQLLLMCSALFQFTVTLSLTGTARKKKRRKNFATHHCTTTLFSPHTIADKLFSSYTTANKFSWGVGIDCSYDGRTRDQKVASSKSGRSGGRIFFFRDNFVCWLFFGVRSTPVLPQWHVKNLGHFAKSADGRLHLSTRTLLTKRSRRGSTMLSRHIRGTYQGNELTRNSSGNVRLRSSQLAEPL